MRAPIQRQTLRTLLLACATGLFADPALASPIYGLIGTIPVPADTAVNPSGKFSSYDISFFDANTQNYYVADRSNASVDVFSAATNTFITRVGGFVGVGPTTSVSGPDGVLVVNLPGQHQLWAGDGNSTLKSFNIGPANTYTPAFPPLNTGGTKRVDEMAFDPSTNHIIVANNADNPPFSTIYNAATGARITRTTFNGVGTPNATGGIEQPTYNATTGKFYISVVQVNGTGPGGVAEVDPNSGAVTRYIDLASFGISACGPAGLTTGLGGKLLVGCGDPSQSIILDPTKTGAATLVATIPQTSGADEVWYDPTTNRYFLADRSDPSGPVLGIIDAVTNSFLQNVPTAPGAHSVAVDPVSGEVFVPLGASAGSANNTICGAGCIGIYGVVGQTAVPEPGSFGLLVSTLAGFAGLLAWRARKTLS